MRRGAIGPLSGGRPLFITPVTLKPRFSASATWPELPPEPGELPLPVDVRQPTLFAAAWTLGSLKYLADSGVGGVTYFETTGWRGVIECAAGSSQAGQLLLPPGAVFPIWHVLAEVGEFAGGEVLRTPSSEPHKVIGLTMSRAGRIRTLIANLTAETQAVWVAVSGGRLSAKQLNDENLGKAMLASEPCRT